MKNNLFKSEVLKKFLNAIYFANWANSSLGWLPDNEVNLK